MMVVWGGVAAVYLNTGGRYDPVTDSWTPTSTGTVPSPRYAHTAVWTGSVMVVWGGYGAGGYLNIGGRYAMGQAVDDDGDGFSECQGDCDDANNQVWSTPGEVRDLNLQVDAQTLHWSAPAGLGGTLVLYDTLRSSAPADFVAAGACVETDDGSDTQAVDPTMPLPGGLFFYLVRAQNSCPSGEGSLGNNSSGVPRAGRSCP